MKRRAAAALLALLLLLGSGCWDLRELNQLALVVAVGIDKSDVPGRFRVTVQVARPGTLAKGVAGGGPGGGPPVYVATADGDTIFAAIRNLAQFVSRRIMWAHNNVVVIGEELAREDITPVVDFFTRNQELRMRTWVVIARGTDARSVVSAPTGMEDLPADSISALFRYAQLPGESIRSDMNEVAAAFFSRELEPVIAAMQLAERSVKPGDSPQEQTPLMQAELRGTAVLKANRLVGFVEKDAGRGLLWLRREMKNSATTLPCPGGRKGNMAVEIRSPSTKVMPQIRRGMPAFQVSIDTEAWITEQDCTTPKMTTLPLKEYAEKEVARQIESQVREALRIVQEELTTDVIKFGQRLHVTQPQWWRANQGRWDELFPEAPVAVSVTVKVPKMGLYFRPQKGHAR